MTYRAEIDGLRAVAVVPVIFFHAGFAAFSGGFVGVDVFFVISGYLITGIIVEDLGRGDFSIANFYERRARRILPALFFMMLVCIPFAWLWMLPQQFSDFGKSLAAVSLFGSNVLFWQETGYFGAAAELKPLLHTWSLAVEEQFYVFYPVLLILLWRFGRNRVFQIIVGIAVVSLAISELGWRFRPSANFYLIPTRAWELFAGAILALVQLNRPQQSNNALALIGIALISFAIFYFDETTPFPSVFALAPVVGTCLIVMYGSRDTLVGRLLATKLLVGIGLISYSAYLWHQPLFAFARIRSAHAPEPWLMIVLPAVAIAMAYFSWRFVEKPARSRTGIFKSRAMIFSLSGAGIVVFLALGMLSQSVLPPYIQIVRPDLFNVYPEKLPTGEPCADFKSVEGQAECTRYGHGDFRVVVWGDSHADALKKGIRVDPSLSVFVVLHVGCPPIVDVIRSDRIGNSENCRNLATTRRYAEFIKSLAPQQIFLVARWTLYLRGWYRDGELQAASHFITDGTVNIVDASTSTATFVQNMTETIRFLQSFSNVAVVSQPPDLNEWGQMARLTSDTVPAATIRAWHEPEFSAFRTVAESAPFFILDTQSLLCSDSVCRLREGGYALYSDDNHLSAFGTRMQWQMMLNHIAPALAPPQ